MGFTGLVKGSAQCQELHSLPGSRHRGIISQASSIQHHQCGQQTASSTFTNTHKPEPAFCGIRGWFGLKETLKITLFQPPAMYRNNFHWTTLLRTPSYLVLNTSRCGADTTSPDVPILFSWRNSALLHSQPHAGGRRGGMRGLGCTSTCSTLLGCHLLLGAPWRGLGPVSA